MNIEVDERKNKKRKKLIKGHIKIWERERESKYDEIKKKLMNMTACSFVIHIRQFDYDEYGYFELCKSRGSYVTWLVSRVQHLNKICSMLQ